MDQADLARWLMRQARNLPADQRIAFQKFIADQMPAPAKRRKIHSWRKAKAAPKRDRPARQMRLDLGKP